MARDIEQGYFHLDTDGYDVDLSFFAQFGDGIPNLTEGYGGWNRVDMPRRPSLTEYIGGPGWTYSIPFLIDEFRKGDSVEKRIRILEKMATVWDHKEPEPPILILDAGGAIPHDYTRASQNRWIVSNIEWSVMEWNTARHRTRAGGTLTLFLYNADKHIEAVKSAKKQSGKSKAQGKPYTVKKGDTLHSIAARVLHNANRWTEIAKLNHIRTSSQVKVGRKLKMPKK
jgi:LysM repeat protein